MNKPDISKRFETWKLPFRINRDLTIDQTYTLAFPDEYTPEIDYDVYLPKYGRNLQRGFVWTPVQKSELIISILENRNIPPLSIIQYRPSVKNGGVTSVWRIIDGKQRLSAVVGYLRNEFPILVDGYEYLYNELPEVLQNRIRFFEFHCDMAYEYDYEPIPDEEKVRWFLHINYAGTPQDRNGLTELNNLING